MAKKQKPEEEKKAPLPIGLIAREGATPQITFTELFDLMKTLDIVNKVVNHIKTANFNADNLRYYFPEDVVDERDAEGNIIMVEGKDGNPTPSRILRPNFWNSTQ